MRPTRAQARAFRARWKVVDRVAVDQQRRTSTTERLRVLAALMASADAVGGRTRLRAEDAEVRRRWARLRRALGG